MARLYIRGYKEEEERKLLGYLECTNFTSYTDFYDVKDFNKIEVRFEVNDEPEAYDTDDEDNPIKQALNRYRQGIKAGVYTSLWKHGKMKTCKYLDCANFTPNSAFYDVTGFDRIRVRFCREDDVKLKGYKKGIKAGVYACLYKDGKFKGCRSIDCANLTSHRDVWDILSHTNGRRRWRGKNHLLKNLIGQNKRVSDWSKFGGLKYIRGTVEGTVIQDRDRDHGGPINGYGPGAYEDPKTQRAYKLCVIVGFVKNRGDSLGILFKGKKGCVYWSFDVFNEFSQHFNSVSLALETSHRFYVKADGGEDIKVINVFGKQCVFIYDGEHSLTLNKHEWNQFIANIPLMHIVLRDLFLIEEPVKTAIENSDSDLLPSRIAHRLSLEIELFKRWPNGGEFVIISHLFRAHIVFKPPYDKAELNSKMARTARWLERHFHNIKWEEGGIEYDEELIRALCKPFATVYTKGLEKVNFLSSFHNNVVDRNVVDSQEAIVSDSHCILPQHNSDFTYACALKKALERGGEAVRLHISRGRVCILHFPIMSDFERLAIVCFLMATTMFVVMLGVLCCAPRARIGNTTVLLLILALLSVVSAGSEDEQPSTASTNGWTGDDDGAIDLNYLQTRPSTSRGGWSASGWSRRGQENSARPRSEPVPIPTTTARPICVIEDVFSLAPHRFRPIRRVEDYMEFCDEDLGQMFAESDLVEALDRAESQEHDREITELLDRLNEPQEVWDETSLDQRISSLQPALLSQSQSAAVQRTSVWGWSLPAGSDDNSYDTSQRRRSVDASVAPSPTPPTRPPSPVPPHDGLSGLSPTGGSSTESASTFLSSPEYVPSIPPSPELPQIRPTPRVSDWEARECIAALYGIRVLMRELQWTASRILLDTDHRRQIRLAPETWRELREDLENFLRSVGERMEDARRNNTTPPPPDAEETPLSQPRKVECPVCMVNLPTVALRLCGHTLCRTCADRVHTCPTCRALIVRRFNIYLPR
ncbi:hypothetical protein J6590_074374 [Homalodisca vitripennis]|nr:hypothetical protein J6590_074374 [Homalodisca vitripennis]